MEGKRLIRALYLQNLLSFGPESEEIILEPLNVLIGLNASGKSNLIESIAILRATPKDLTAPIREGGGIGGMAVEGRENHSNRQGRGNRCVSRGNHASPLSAVHDAHRTATRDCR
jgi:predicted ATPase